MNEASIGGIPADGDPIYSNPTGSDHPIILLILNGTLFQAGA